MGLSGRQFEFKFWKWAECAHFREKYLLLLVFKIRLKFYNMLHTIFVKRSTTTWLNFGSWLLVSNSVLQICIVFKVQSFPQLCPPLIFTANMPPPFLGQFSQNCLVGVLSFLGGGRGCAGTLTRPSTRHLLPKNFEKNGLKKGGGAYLR